MTHNRFTELKKETMYVQHVLFWRLSHMGQDAVGFFYQIPHDSTVFSQPRYYTHTHTHSLILVSLNMSCFVKSSFFSQLHIFHYNLCNSRQIWGNKEPKQGRISSKPVSGGWICFPSSGLLSRGERRIIFTWHCTFFLQTVCHTNIPQRRSCSGGKDNLSRRATAVTLQHPQHAEGPTQLFGWHK